MFLGGYVFPLLKESCCLVAGYDIVIPPEYVQVLHAPATITAPMILPVLMGSVRLLIWTDYLYIGCWRKI